MMENNRNNQPPPGYPTAGIRFSAVAYGDCRVKSRSYSKVTVAQNRSGTFISHRTVEIREFTLQSPYATAENLISHSGCRRAARGEEAAPGKHNLKGRERLHRRMHR